MWEDEVPELHRDPKTDETKEALKYLFVQEPERVFYGRQLEVLLEDDFFHWIVNRAVRELAAERVINSAELETRAGYHIRFTGQKRIGIGDVKLTRCVRSLSVIQHKRSGERSVIKRR